MGDWCASEHRAKSAVRNPVAAASDPTEDEPPAAARSGSNGWWDWYFALLKQGRDAPIAVFYDAVQRPDFRGPEGFDPDKLRNALGNAVHVRLKKALRYTSPIYGYLKSLRHPSTHCWTEAIEAHEHLPTGAPVVRLESTKENAATSVNTILKDWCDKGLCKPADVVIIGQRKLLANSSLGSTPKLCGVPLLDFAEDTIGKIGYIGAHRSKGLDFLAVILIDFPPFESLGQGNDNNHAETFFLAASRARQLLGVVSIIDNQPTS